MNWPRLGRRWAGAVALMCATGVLVGPAAATSPIATKCQVWAVGQPRDDKPLAVHLGVLSSSDAEVPAGTADFAAQRMDKRYAYDFSRKYSTPKVFHLGTLHSGSYRMGVVYEVPEDSSFTGCSAMIAFEVRKTA